MVSPTTIMQETWSEFASNSTLHGLRYVVGLSSLPRRLLWVICMLVATSFYLYFLQDSVQKYISLPISSQISHEFPEGGTPFPSVTICNLNSVMKSKADIGYNDERFKKLKLDLPACDFIRNVSGNLTCGQALLCAYHEYGTKVVSNCDNRMRLDIHDALNTSSRVFNPEEFLRVYGQDIHTMLISYCRFSTDYMCSAEDFKPVLTPRGLCYNFSPNSDKGAPRKVYYAGGEGGLRVLLDTKTNESTIGDWSVGFCIVMNKIGEVANRNRGFNVFPGSHTMVAVSPKIFKRLPAPYKPNCSERHLPGYPVYTKDACIAQSFNNATIAACGCRLQGEPGFPNTSVCSLQDNNCIRKAKEKVKLSANSCSLPCKETYFESRVSYSRIPNQVVVKITQETLGLNRSEEYMRNNFVYLQVGYVELAYQVDEQVPAYGPSSLFGDIGGNMGLLLGSSLLTVVEFIDYLCVMLVTRIQSKKKRKVDSLDQNNVAMETSPY